MIPEWPLVGRDTELRALRTEIVQEHRGVVLTGAPGVGKTRLANAVLDSCPDTFAIVRVLATRSSATIPLGAFATVLTSIGLEVDDPSGPARLLQRCLTEIQVTAAGRRLILAVDDAHLLDDLSLTLLVHVIESDSATPLLTVRAGDGVPEAIVGLWSAGRCGRVEIKPLDGAQVAEVLSHSLGGPVDEATVAEFLQHSGGNHLFLRELVSGAMSEGALRKAGGAWRLVGELQASERLVEIIEARLAVLAPPERALLEFIAFGEPLTSSELGELGDLSAAESLEAKALIVVTPAGRDVQVRLAHPMYGEVVRDRVPFLRTRTIARALARALEVTGTHMRDPLRVATLRMVGGGGHPRSMYEAARLARWRYDFALAERLARGAVEVGGGVEAQVLAAQMASLQGRAAQADEELAGLADASDDDSFAARITLLRLDNGIIYSGRVVEGLELAIQWEQRLPPGPARDEVAARRCALVLGRDGPGAALAVCEPLLENSSGHALAWACMPGSFVLARAGHLSEAVEVARQGRRIHQSLDEPTDWYSWMHTFYEAEALTHLGRFAEAGEISMHEYRRGVQERSLEAQGLFGWQLAKGVADRGDVDDAIRYAGTAASVYRQLERPQFVDFCLIPLALAYALAGQATECEETLRSRERLGLDSSYFMGVDPLQVQGWLAVARGQLREALSVLLDAADTGRRIGDLVGALASLHSAARIGFPDKVASEAGDLCARIDGELAAARLQHIAALAERDPAQLEAASLRFETLGATLLAAEAAADASVHFERHGQVRRKNAALNRAAALAQVCRGARTPALQALAARARLTRSEWETAQLAAKGQSNKDIAATLVLSVRTVENRLQQVYAKLGVRQRTDLAAALDSVVEPDG